MLNAPISGPKSLIEMLCAPSVSKSFPPWGIKQLGTMNDSFSQVTHSGGHGMVGTMDMLLKYADSLGGASPAVLWAPPVLWASADVSLRAVEFERKWARKLWNGLTSTDVDGFYPLC